MAGNSGKERRRYLNRQGRFRQFVGDGPRTTDAIEAVMKRSSPLDDFQLPKLDR